MQRSILGQLLPEAMVCFLENYGKWVGGWRVGGLDWEGNFFKHHCTMSYGNTIFSSCVCVCALGPDKFSETFLGEFDTPEAIWNSEMRLDGHTRQTGLDSSSPLTHLPTPLTHTHTHTGR